MTEGEGGVDKSAAFRTGELPPEVFPYKKSSQMFIAPDGRRLLDVTSLEKFVKQQEQWWKRRYGDKVPRKWLTDPWGIEKYIRRHSRTQLQGNEFLLEAIAACPSTIFTILPFYNLAEKTPLSAWLLALGFVNALSQQPLIKESILLEQRKLGVSQEVLEEAQRLVAQWESQLQEFK